MASLAIAGAAGTAAAAYLNAKFHLGKDARALWMLKQSEWGAAKAADKKRQSLFYPFEETCKRTPTARMIWSRSGSYTFAEAYLQVMQYANWLQEQGAQPKQAIGLYASNSPEFMFIVLACWAIGCFPALINYNLADASLVHCAKVAKAQLLLVEGDPDLIARIEGSAKELSEAGIRPLYMTDEVKAHVATRPDTRPPNSMRDHAGGLFPMSLIYTSGTTGMPKAFPMATMRSYGDYVRFGIAMEQRAKERGSGQEVWYDCMPLYHGTGFIVGVMTALNGATLAIGHKFSASHFWQDVVDSEATAFVYVGETARYLLATPPSPLDRAHKLELMYGNGMRPDVWDRFQARFGVPEVNEFFTSTEGMFAIAIYTRSGFGARSVGHHGAILRALLHKTYVPVALDPNTNDMWRDPKTGFARRVSYEQGGEIIVKLPERAAWPGYYNNVEGTNKKLATDVFEKGDIYYRPGDALRRDGDGLWFFLDRLGDTFRWKGENVSTAEVQEVMGSFPGLGEANVYGVEVPGSEGRAGCAAIVLGEGAGSSSGSSSSSSSSSSSPSPDSFDWAGLTRFLRQKLPRYAVPVFIRVIDAAAAGGAQAMGTHNNKQNKVLLRAEGADPAKLGSKVVNGKSDRLFWLRPGADAYVPLELGQWGDVQAGRAKL